MKHNFLGFSGMAILSFGLLLATPGAFSQMRGGGSTGGQPGGVNQPGLTPNGLPQNGPQSPQNSAEISFLANMQRNNKVETDLSKMAMKNSSNDDVKKFAQQVIQENHRDEMTLTNAISNANSSGMPFSAPVPDQTHKAEKQMKKMTGTPFDQMYLVQMDGYVKNDQKIISEDASNIQPSDRNSADMGSLTMQLRNTAAARAKQITQVAQSENFKIE